VDILRNRITPRRGSHVANALSLSVFPNATQYRRAWQETASLTHRMQAFERCSSTTLCQRTQQQ
jgi:hypothetical protein